MVSASDGCLIVAKGQARLFCLAAGLPSNCTKGCSDAKVAVTTNRRPVIWNKGTLLGLLPLNGKRLFNAYTH